MKFKFLNLNKVSLLPKSSGVYAFKDGREFLYIGKAANIKERAKNHLGRSSFQGNFFINKAEKVGFLKTDSEIEALILEANLIKKYKPKYNVVWRDDKNYFFVAITKEDFPRVFIVHQPFSREANYIGPFVEGTALKKVLRILRKIFPYYTAKKHPKTLCSWCQLGFCPGPFLIKKDYQKNIRSLIAILKGKRGTILERLKKEMRKNVSLKEFEKAVKIRDKIFALENVLSHAKIFEPQLAQRVDWPQIQKILQKILKIKNKISRIEAYDVSNIQGKLATGSMVSFVKGVPDRNSYRRFKIKITNKPDDLAMIKEIMVRRFGHREWPFPQLILIDGGKAQLNVGLKIIRQKRIKGNLRAISLAKKENKLFVENKKKPILLKNLPRDIFNLILRLRDEAHRFAISYHKKLREVDLRTSF